jgi:hypothetical protein
LPQRTYPSDVASPSEPELLHGPRSFGTQASIAPPLRNPTPVPMATPAAQAAVLAAAPHADMAAAPNPVRPVAPALMAGTMLDRAPGIAGSPLGPAPIAPSASSAAHSASAAFAARFEQVPSARGSLAQQQTGFGLHIPIDQSSSDWGRASLDQTGAGQAQHKPRSQLRWIALTALAVAAVGVAAFGKQLLSRVTSSRNDAIEQRVAERESESPKQTTLTNLPGTVAPAAAPPAAGLPAVAAAAAAPAAAPAVLPSVRVSEEKAEALDPAAAKAAEAARKQAEAAASPESRLAAQAARHVLGARYADALPLYRQLQQSYPQNTAYAAMVRVLEQKTAPGAKGAQP